VEFRKPILGDKQGNVRTRILHKSSQVAFNKQRWRPNDSASQMTFDVDIWHDEVNFSAYVYNNTNNEEEKKHNTTRRKTQHSEEE